MQVLSMVWGILAIAGMMVGFIPCLGALNWLNIPFAGISLVISVISLATAREGNKGGSIAAIICCAIACLFGLVRLAAGGGLL